eukprot:gnl/MRDRNA2_/MRDRNA2_85526_c0_seq1.p1 gnl/MRDRNA2_/MRDRNA2_85526_c0~~gnl/MRDRNA2_/MRDRNA2_85526_c0_seq1.p1  ORF type:complete len:417 (-),score=33.81 gnl/MRDRNA2_/MRDRNA2_85526_c0_seq1:131-1381(-)
MYCFLVSVVLAVVAWIQANHPDRYNKDYYHKLHQAPKTKMSYTPSDFGDYVIMLALTAALVRLAWGTDHICTTVAYMVCTFLFGAFIVRHGCVLRLPFILSEPFGLIRHVLHELDNIRAEWLLSVAALCFEQALIQWTPEWPHMTDAYGYMSWYIFHGCFAAVTVARTVFFVAHIWDRRKVFDFLQRSPWQKIIGKPSAPLELVHLLHAYATGLLVNTLGATPGFLLMCTCQRSMLLAPFRIIAERQLLRRWNTRTVSGVFYRDHWLLHHLRLSFIYLHGPHHDAIPVSFIAAHEGGMLEELLQYSIIDPVTFFTPFHFNWVWWKSVYSQMVEHQYVPGVMPYTAFVREHEVHHAEHHLYGLWPLGDGTKIDTFMNKYEPLNKNWSWFAAESEALEKENVKSAEFFKNFMIDTRDS